jgi:hypothetical protein
MAITYWPFQAGAGAPVLDSQWQTMMSLMFRDGVWVGVLNQLNVVAGSGLQVTVDTGDSMTTGLFMNNSALFAINLATADPTNPRIDNIVVHADLVARTVTLIALTGTPAGSPVAPAVTQNASVWEISLNNVRVNANATVPSTFTDTRIWTPNWNAIYQLSGVGLNSVCGGQATATATAQVWGWSAPFGRVMQKAPTSITLTTIVATNANTQTATQLGFYGFLFTANAPAASLITAYDSYLTVGNTLLGIGPDSFDHHCDGCEVINPKQAVKRGRSLSGDMQIVDVGNGMQPGAYALRHECPECGMVECWNTALAEADERAHLPGWEQRMQDAFLIRQAQDQLKLPRL